MTLSARDMWFLGIAGTLALALIVNRLTDDSNRRNTARVAAATFRNSINPEIFKELRGHLLHKALIETFPELKKAVNEFRIHLGIIRKFRLNRAWEEYHGGNEEYPDFFVMYCLQDNGPLLLKERLERLRKIGEIT